MSAASMVPWLGVATDRRDLARAQAGWSARHHRQRLQLARRQTMARSRSQPS